MLEYNVPQEYESKIQEILSPFSIEVDVKDTSKIESAVNSIWQGLMESSKSKPEVQLVNFEKEETVVRDMEQPSVFRITQWLKNTQDSALMLSTKEGAVFCLSYTKVGDKGYLQCLTPESAKLIRDEQRKLFEENGLEVPREMTFFEWICNAFSRIFHKRPIEVAARREAYLKFYENAQQAVERAETLAEKGVERKAQKEAESAEGIMRKLHEKQQQEREQEEIRKKQEIEQRKQEKLEKIQAEQVQKEQEALEQEKQRKTEAENERLKRMKALEEKIPDLQQTIQKNSRLRQQAEKEYKVAEQNYLILQNEFDKETEYIKNQMKTAKEMDEKITVLREKLKENEKNTNLSKRKIELEKEINEHKSAMQRYEKEANTAENRLFGKKIDFERVSEQGSCVSMTVTEYLEDVYKKDKASREKEYETKKKQLDEQIDEQKQLADKCKLQIEYFKKQFGRSISQDVKNMIHNLEESAKKAEENRKQLQKQAAQEKTDFETWDKEKQKELRKPDKDTIQKTETYLKDLREKYQKAKNDYDAERKQRNELKDLAEKSRSAYNLGNQEYHSKKYRDLESLDYYAAQRKTLEQEEKEAVQARAEAQKNVQDLRHEQTVKKPQIKIGEAKSVLHAKKIRFDNLDAGLKKDQRSLNQALNELQQLKQPEMQQPKQDKGGLGKGMA